MDLTTIKKKLKPPSSNSDNAKHSDQLVYQLEGRPRLRIAVPLGLQHVLTMFAGNLAPVLILAGVVSAATGDPIVSPEQKVRMVQLAMFVSGITTFIQLYPIKIGKFQIGAGLPIVMGTSSVFIGALMVIGAEFGLPVVFGTIIVGSLAEVCLGVFLKPLKRFLPPIVIGCVLLAIGLSLLPIGVMYFAGGAAAEVAAKKAAELTASGAVVPSDIAALAQQYGSWQNIVTGSVVIAVIVLFQRFAKGIPKALAILAGILAGYIASAVLGLVDFSRIGQASFISLPIPTIFPEFQLGPILAIAALYLISGLETMGNTNGITAAAFDREATPREVSGAIVADAMGSMLAGWFNTLPNTAFGENAGIVAMTKVVNKFAVATGSCILVLASCFPMFGSIFSIMPSSVLGGAAITIFGMIITNGMKLIFIGGLSDRNVLIICLSFGIGFGISQSHQLVAGFPAPLDFAFSQTTLTVSLVAILANIVFGKDVFTLTPFKRKPAKNTKDATALPDNNPQTDAQPLLSHSTQEALKETL